MPEKADWTREEIESNIEMITAVAIPVNLQMEGKTWVLDFHEVEAILRKANLIALGKCACRKTLQKCGAPLDVCIGLDEKGQTFIEKGSYHKVSLDEAITALRRSHDAGLVHLAFTLKEDTKPFVICSCCNCCCQALTGLIRFKIPEIVVASNLVAEQNPETCLHCGICVDRCHFKARQLEKGELTYDVLSCFGCGVCVTSCPTNSIKMVKRD